MWHSQCFKIQILKTKGDPLDVSKATPIYQINGCEHLSSYFSIYPPHQEADPFLFVYNERLFLFYESKPFYKKGVICMVSSCDMKHWTNPIVVLEEPFHLSYPNVFVDNGEVYMIPESCADKSIRLYKANNNDLTSFSLCKKLLSQYPQKDVLFSFSDTSICKKNGLFYLFTSIFIGDAKKWEGTYQLYLYTSDKLDGEYHKHPQNPICIRCANLSSRFFYFLMKKRLYRLCDIILLLYTKLIRKHL